MSEEIASKQYANKIMAVAHYGINPNKEVIGNIIDALIKEFADQQTKALQDELTQVKEQNKQLIEILKIINEVVDKSEYNTD